MLDRKLLGVLWVVFFCLWSSSSWAVQDDRGVSVQFTQAPQRIVSLLPSLTESVCALGQCQRLVGIDRYSNYPAQVQTLPRLGGGLDPNVEAVMALKPDLVLIATSARAAERLEALGLKVLALEPKNLTGVERTLKLLAEVLQVGTASSVWQQLQTQLQLATASLPTQTHSIQVYFELGDGSYAASPDSFIGELLNHLGVHNITPSGLGPFPRLNPEFVVRANPDVIMMSERGRLSVEQRPGWRNLRAVQQRRLCTFTPEESDILARAGPRLGQAAYILAQCLRRTSSFIHF